MAGVSAAPILGEHLQHAADIRGRQLGVFVEHDRDLVTREAFDILEKGFAAIGITLVDVAT